VEKTNLSVSGTIKFISYSILGVAAFFVPITIGGSNKIPIDHITSLLYGVFEPFYTYIVLALCVYAFIDMYLTKSYKRSAVDVVLSAAKVLGFVIALLILFKVNVPYLMEPGIAPATLINMGRSTVMIICVAFFLPFLLDYGLIDAVGIIAKPFMRPVFKLPGITAVVVASALLGNFSIGLLSTSKLYKAGRLTKKESAIIATGFSSISIGLMLLFTQLLKLSDRFLFYFCSTTLVTYIVTAITVRIPPISATSEDYCEGVAPYIEEDVKEKKFKQAFTAGVEVAAKASSPLSTVGAIIFATLRVLANMISSSMFIIVAGLLLNAHTPLFQWIGMIFYPVLWVFNMSNMDVLLKCVGLAAIDVIPAVMYGSSQELTLAARYVLAAMPASVIIFIGGYFTCLISADVPVKIRDLVFLWFERMLLSLVFYCAIALIFFG